MQAALSKLETENAELRSRTEEILYENQRLAGIVSSWTSDDKTNKVQADDQHVQEMPIINADIQDIEQTAPDSDPADPPNTIKHGASPGSIHIISKLGLRDAGIDQLNFHSVQLGYLKLLQMGNTDPNNKSRKRKYEVKPQLSLP
ncbi:hypothetical protein F511_09201 [Dorcoceras hygrometricum]|uniref:Uncharacterized protein n=1 Tax=Dorcoceras hygrometricum TaxID=472368 RepID=A0A2Z7AZN1_9LAMI|nr:hypothetical protein F511_09201 [Dorcoceras hygrometricum]